MAHAIREGLEIHYELTGTGEPVVFLPGVFSTRQVWGPVVRRLAGLRSMLLMDHRDSGLSSTSPGSYTVCDLALDAIAVLDHACVERAHLTGHSMGGAVAQEMALISPERILSLTLVNSWARTDVYSASVMRMMRLMRGRLKDDREFLQFNSFLINSPVSLRFMAPEDIAQSILNYGPVQPEAGFLRNLDAAMAFDALDRLNSVTCPAAVIWGDQDKVFPEWHAAELVHALARSVEIKLPGVGHMAPLQSADYVSGAIRKIVSGGIES
jgi:pimeloyl-ACP methyl ester carboxylesterase